MFIRWIKYGYILGFFLLTGCAAQWRLDHSWPEKYGAFSDLTYASVGKGYILKKSGDTLKGYIKMVTDLVQDDTATYIPLLPYNKKSKTGIVNVKTSDIDYVRLKINLKDTFSVDYTPIYDRMWEMLGRNDRVMICYRKIQNRVTLYDGSLPTYTEQLFLLKGGWMIAIPPRTVNFSFNPTHVSALWSFISGRYDRDELETIHFKNEAEMISYILKEEQLSDNWRIPGPYYPFKRPKLPGRSSAQ
jgi:hypothetical protein